MSSLSFQKTLHPQGPLGDPSFLFMSFCPAAAHAHVSCSRSKRRHSSFQHASVLRMQGELPIASLPKQYPKEVPGIRGQLRSLYFRPLGPRNSNTEQMTSQKYDLKYLTGNTCEENTGFKFIPFMNVNCNCTYNVYNRMSQSWGRTERLNDTSLAKLLQSIPAALKACKMLEELVFTDL